MKRRFLNATLAMIICITGILSWNISVNAEVDSTDINMEYLYAFMSRTEKHAYVVLRVADNALAESALEKAGFHLITDADVAKL